MARHAPTPNGMARHAPTTTIGNMQTGGRSWPALTAPTVVAILAFAVNANLLRNGFVYDDGAQVLNNPYLLSPRYLGKIFSTNVWSFIGPEGTSNYYRPLMHVINKIGRAHV